MFNLMLLRLLVPFGLVLVLRSVVVMLLVHFVTPFENPDLKEIMSNGSIVSLLTLFCLSGSFTTLTHAVVTNDCITKNFFAARVLLHGVMGSSVQSPPDHALAIAFSRACAILRPKDKAAVKDTKSKADTGAGDDDAPPGVDVVLSWDKFRDKESKSGHYSPVSPAGPGLGSRRRCGCLHWCLSALGGLVLFPFKLVWLLIKVAFFVDTGPSVTSPTAVGLGLPLDTFSAHVTLICASTAHIGVIAHALHTYFEGVMEAAAPTADATCVRDFRVATRNIHCAMFSTGGFMQDALLAGFLSVLYLVLPTYLFAEYGAWGVVPLSLSTIISLSPLVISRALRNPFRHFTRCHINTVKEHLGEILEVVHTVSVELRLAAVCLNFVTCGLLGRVIPIGGQEGESFV